MPVRPGYRTREIRVSVTPRRYAARMMSERDRQVLDFEGSWWLYPGPKDRAIREYLGVSATRYYQVLRRLIDASDALEYDPLTIRRLQGMRRQRLDQIAERVSGAPLP